MLTPTELQARIAAVQNPMNAAVTVWNTAAQPAITVTYQFEAALPPDIFGYSGWQLLEPAGQATVRSCLAEYASIINVRFVETTGVADADLSIGRALLGYTGGQGGFQYSYSTDGFGTLTKTLDSWSVFSPDAVLDRNLALHELGHAMTLKHPGNYDVSGGGGTPPFLPAAEDNNKLTVMSYNDNPVNGQTSPHLMLYDIAALQARFGANLTTRTGNDLYTGPDGTIQAIWDAGGSDTISGAGRASPVTIDLRAGAFSSLGATDNLAIAYGVTIEGATGGSANDVLVGNASANVLVGGAGADTMTGLAGNDIYGVDNLADVVVEASGGGSDTIRTTVSYALASTTDVEVLAAASAAATTPLSLGGNGLANTLLGNAGADLLNGGGGADTMIGYGGDDRYYVDTAADRVTEVAGGGRDTVFARVSYALAAAADVESLRAYDPAATTALNLTGNGLANVLQGNAGANGLNGGAGADVMTGFGGNDSYLVDQAADIVVEAAGGGVDTVFAATSYGLGTTSEVEVLRALVPSATAAMNLYGNGFSQVIIGNAGNNLIASRGGADTVAGGAGADTFLFDTAPASATRDVVTDFNPAFDTLRIENAVFAGLPLAGVLSAADLRAGAGVAAAADASDRFLYNTSTGELWFDADGTGVAAAIRFAVLQNKAALTAADFLVV